MKKTIILLIFVITSITNICLSSQLSTPLIFETISSNGISLNTRIYNIVKDPFGFLWLGTDYGLLRYDGYRTLRIDYPDIPEFRIINSIGVESLIPGNDTSLWIGTEHGLFNLNLINLTISSPQHFKNSNIRSLLLENDSSLWIGTTEGLYNYDPLTKHRKHFSTINSGLSQNVIRTIYLDKDKNLWVGTEDKLNVLDAGSLNFVSFNLKGNYKPEIKNNLILDIQADTSISDSMLYIGTETGICLFNRYNHTFRNYNIKNSDLTNDVSKTSYILDSETIFIGTDLGFFMLNLTNNEVEKYYHNPFNQYSIVNNEIWEIYPDGEGNLWLATSNGINRVGLKENVFEYFPVYSREKEDVIGIKVSDVCFDALKTYWVSTGNGMFFSSSEIKNQTAFTKAEWNSNLSIENINSIYIDSRNRIWIGSVAGLNIWDPASKKVYFPKTIGGPASRVASSYISNIIQGNNEDIWIGTWGGGLYNAKVIDNTENININYIADINGPIVKGDENIWALYDNSFYKFSFHTEKVEQIEIPSFLALNSNISSICYSKSKSVWLGTKNTLINYNIEKDSFKVVSMPIVDELIVTGIIEDNNGIIWGAGNNSLFNYNTSSGQFNFFPISDNIPLKKFILSPFRKTADNKLIACGYDGYLKFNPDDFFSKEHNYKVYLTALRINGELMLPNKKINNTTVSETVISVANNLELNYQNRNISLEFSSFLYNVVKQEQYSCMLDGYESDWRNLETGTNLINYVNLPPGSYTFKVKRFGDRQDESITTLDIRIEYPVWARIPLLILYLALLLFVIVFIFFQYHRNIKYRSQMSFIQLEKEKNELLTSSKIKFYINISHELLTSISLIIDPVKRLLKNNEIKGSANKTLKLIDRNAHFLKVYIDQLLNFRKIETGHNVNYLEDKLELVAFSKESIEFFKNRTIAKGIRLKLKSQFKELEVITDEEKLFSIFQNLLSNAIKYTPEGGKILVNLKLGNENEVIIEIKDSGIGISTEEQEMVFERFYQVKDKAADTSGAGIGLTIVKDFVKILQGRIELDSLPGVGSTFRIILPSNLELPVHSEDEKFVKDYVNQEIIEEARSARLGDMSEDSGLPKVLIVDQNEDIYLYISSSLNKKFHFFWARTGNHALELVKSIKSDIIISELQLPDIDGITFCERVRKNQLTSRIPFISLTAKTEIENQLKAIEAGVDIFLAKPFEIEVLEANIINLLRRTLKTEEFITRRLLMNSQNIEIESKDDKLLKEVVDYIHQNITKTNITAEEISYSVGVSHSSLYRKIKKITGQSLNEFIRYIRLQKAEKLLGSGNFSVSEVIYQVGFTNHSYFAKRFKNQFGINPKEYTKMP